MEKDMAVGVVDTTQLMVWSVVSPFLLCTASFMKTEEALIPQQSPKMQVWDPKKAKQ